MRFVGKTSGSGKQKTKMSGAVPKITLNNGRECPQIGLGTWQSAPGEVERAVKQAIDFGYRHIDCAMVYGNEKEIGNAIRDKIKEGTVQRSDLFITTKLWNTFHETEKVVPACRQSLENFGLDYVDLYLVHWPVAQKLIGPSNKDFPFENAVGIDYDYVDTWKGMEECYNLGLAKSIGVSNFNRKQINRLCKNCVIIPAMNQIEVHPNLNQRDLIAYCKSKGIEITAYSPFGSPARPWAKKGDPIISMDNPALLEIGKTHHKTAAQVILRYIVQLGCIPVPKSTNPERLKQNLNIFDFELSSYQMDLLDSLDCNGRAITATELKGMPHYPFDDVHGA